MTRPPQTLPQVPRTRACLFRPIAPLARRLCRFALFSAAVAAATAAIPLEARAQEPAQTTFNAANQLEGWYATKDRESLLDDRFDIRVARGPYAIGGTLLSHSPSNMTVLDPNDFGPQKQGIRKRWVEASTERFFLRAGNVYATFGRGLALAIFEEQPVDFDNTLDGVQASARTDRVEVEVVSGTNAYGSPGLILKGGRLGSTLPGSWKAGLTGVWADHVDAGGARVSGDRLYGGSLQSPSTARADLYGEYVLRDRRDADGKAAHFPQGHAGYASANLYLGRVQLTGEYKDLLRYDLPTVDNRAWVLPPTAVRAHANTLLGRGAHTPNIFPADERAGLAEAQVNLAERTRAVASYSRSRARHLPFASWEIYGEVEQWLGEMEIILRTDETEETIREGEDLIFLERLTYGGTLVAPLPAEWSLDLSFDTQDVAEINRTTQAYAFPVKYSGQVATATVSRAGGLTLAAVAEWTGDERQERRQWLWLECGLRLGERHQLTVGGGRQRGGQVCSGGVCKLVDPFEGGRLELLTNF